MRREFATMKDGAMLFARLMLFTCMLIASMMADRHPVGRHAVPHPGAATQNRKATA